MIDTIFKNICENNSIDFEELKCKWEESKEISKLMGKENHFSYALGVLKNMIGLKEIKLSIENFTDLFLHSENTNFETFYEELVSADIPPSLRPEIPYKGKISTGKGDVDQEEEDNEEKIKKVEIK